VLKGIFPPLATPFDASGALDLRAFESNFDTYAAHDLGGYLVLGSNGESPYLDDEEREKLVRAARKGAGKKPLLVGTGFSTLIAAPFGGHAINLAAITAAICAGPDAHPDPKRRYIAAVTSGVAYVAMGILAPFAAGFITASPPILIEAVAGLALLGAFGSASLAFLSAPKERDAALVTFITTASGFSVFGIGAAFWGLVAGGAVLALHRIGRQA
jgi:predicted benzoate:H+ symporter BenE